MIQTLREMGLEVLCLDVDAASQVSGNAVRDAVEFAPDFVIPTTFNYYLAAALQERDIYSVLACPVIVQWDDPLGALANYVLESERNPVELAQAAKRRIFSGHPIAKLRDLAFANPQKNLGRFLRAFSPQTREIGPLQTFKEVMQSPLVKHVSWDTGHIEAVNELELVEPEKVQWLPPWTHAPFIDQGKGAGNVKPTMDVAFCGNVYLDMVAGSKFWQDDFFRSLTNEICNATLEQLDKSAWDLLNDGIERLPEATREQYDLYWDRKVFWEYYVFLVWHAVTTFVRVGILTKVNMEVNMCGLFADPASIGLLGDHPNLQYRGNFHHSEELPQVYASTKINVCISNGLVYKGVPSKLIDCLASGGFALSDPKEDLVRLFGPDVKRIFFRDAAELNHKIEYFLARPAERKEISDALRAKVQQECGIRECFEQILDRCQ